MVGIVKVVTGTWVVVVLQHRQGNEVDEGIVVGVVVGVVDDEVLVGVVDVGVLVGVVDDGIVVGVDEGVVDDGVLVGVVGEVIIAVVVLLLASQVSLNIPTSISSRSFLKEFEVKWKS